MKKEFETLNVKEEVSYPVDVMHRFMDQLCQLLDMIKSKRKEDGQ